MKRLALTAAVLLGIAAFSSCTKEYDPAPEFVSGDTICLKVEGKTIHTYDPVSWQASYRTKTNQFRVFSDDNSSYYKLICSEKPQTEGQTVTATLAWASSSSSVQKRENVKLTVQRIDNATGTVWLWSPKSNIGVAVILAE